MASEIHVGDYNTEYLFPLYDTDQEEVNFNPSGATTKKLTFKNPGVEALQERNAVVTQRKINGIDNIWCLAYVVTKADVDNQFFHIAPGLVKIQAVIDFTTGKWSSNIVSKDAAGEEIRVYPNLV